jgi:phosphoribosylpyrophosphate synthetase
MPISNSQKEDVMTIKRLANLNDPRSPHRYEKRGIEFLDLEESKTQNTINLYNHGCPLEKWKIDSNEAWLIETEAEPKKAWNTHPSEVQQTKFKVFDTGDAFSTVSPHVNFDGASVNIHVGVEHKQHSPLVLLHEALQLCRTASEHNANKITIALPEQYHPVLHPSDFNVLLANLFNASGAGNIYFYDQTYQGKYLEKNENETVSCDKKSIINYLAWNPQGTNDEQVTHHMRKHAMTRVLSQFEMNQTANETLLSEDHAPKNIRVSGTKNLPHILLCGSANRPFALKIAKELEARGETVKIYLIEGQGENAKLPSNAKLCGATVTIVQSTRPNPEDINTSREYRINGASSYLFETMMIARQAHLKGALQINLVNPYQFSARSDKAENNTTNITGAYVELNGLLLKSAGVNRVITAECHDPHTLSGTYTDKKIRASAVPALKIMSTAIAKAWMQSTEHGQLRLVIPDEGAAKRTKELRQALLAMLGKRLCESCVLGEKERASHADDSASIKNLNLGSVIINAHDKYLITDDETATGSTLCQAIQGIKQQGAKDIAVAVVHNNMPLDWLVRQLCLARFLSLDVSEMHFSDTQEMGMLAKNYDDLIQTYSKMTSSSVAEVEAAVVAWFKEPKNKMAALEISFDKFKDSFSQLSTRIKVHSLVDAFVDKFSHKMQPQLFAAQSTSSSVYKANTLFSANNLTNKGGKEESIAPTLNDIAVTQSRMVV